MVIGKKNYCILSEGNKGYFIRVGKGYNVGIMFKDGKVRDWTVAIGKVYKSIKLATNQCLFPSREEAQAFIDKCLATKKKLNKNTVELNNRGPAVRKYNFTTWLPRLQVNKHGEIILSINKGINGLTTGILIGKTKGAISKSPIGQFITDWEVCGELTDYDGEVTITFKNEFKNNENIS